MDVLTDRQRRVYVLIRKRIEKGLSPPTHREIMDKCGVATITGVACHLRALERKGWVRREPDKARAIRLTEKRLPRGYPIFGPWSFCGKMPWEINAMLNQ